LLGIEEVVGHVLDRDSGPIGARLAAGVEGIVLFQIRFQGGVGIGSHAEVMQLPPSFLGPLPAGMREEG
jgi:hypothetical protein